MKYLRHRLLIIFMIAIFANCDDNFLDTPPNDRIVSEFFWNSDNDAIMASNALYPFLLQDAMNFAMWDAMSDIGHVTLQWRQESIIERGFHNAASPTIARIWSFAYEGIQGVNIFLANVDDFVPASPSLIERLKAEMRVIRAKQYIDLAMLFGDVPMPTSELTLEESLVLTRTPVSEVWDFISSELTSAAAVLPTTASQTGRITKGAALGLKTRALLYAGRYNEAAEAAKEVIDLGVYHLYPSYENLFTYDAQNSSEVILDRQYTQNVNQSNIYDLTTPNSLWPQTNDFVPTKLGVDIYKMANGKDIIDPSSGFDPNNPYSGRDPRLGYNIFTIGSVLPNGLIYDSRPGSGTGDAVGSSENSTFSGFNVKKYLTPEDSSNPNNCGINLILLRYADVLLMYAEAKVEANDIDQSVLDAINEVRSRPDVNMPAISGLSDQAELRQIVRDERVVELAFEGLRYFDIKRWKIAENLTGTIFGMTYENNDGNLTTIELTGFNKAFNKDRDYLWPIPFNELVLNPNLTQNPGW